MIIEQYLIFITLTFIVMATPGPAVLHSIHNGALYGAKNSTIAVLGNVAALLIMVILSGVGLGAILLASEWFFSAIKLIGALYLLYLGIRLWINASAPMISIDSNIINRKSLISSLIKRAFLVTSTNPKAFIFVGALLPQFVDINQPLLLQIVILASTVAIIQFGVLVTYALLANSIRPILKVTLYRIIFNRSCSVVFVIFALLLGLSDTTNKER